MRIPKHTSSSVDRRPQMISQPDEFNDQFIQNRNRKHLFTSITKPDEPLNAHRSKTQRSLLSSQSEQNILQLYQNSQARLHQSKTKRKEGHGVGSKLTVDYLPSNHQNYFVVKNHSREKSQDIATGLQKLDHFNIQGIQ